MKKNVNHTADSVGKIHAITFSAFIVVNIVIKEVLLSELFPLLGWNVSDGWQMVIDALIDALLYAGIYAIVKWIFDLVLVKTNKEIDIEGRWYHAHLPRVLGEIDYTSTRVSAGYTDVVRELYDFTFDGHNRHYELVGSDVVPLDDYSTHWFSRTTEYIDVNEFDVIEIYEAESRGRSSRTLEVCPCCKSKFDVPVQITDSENSRYGIHTYKFVKGEDGKTAKMDAEFADCWPSLKSGDLWFFRTEAERDAFGKAYFKKGEAERAKAAAKTE